MPPTLFSIGYQELTPASLAKLVQDLDCTLIDCRTYPSGRVKKGFSRLDLTALMGERYEWQGKQLGGKGQGVTAAGLEWLKAQDGRRLMLMCMEHSPGDCHRFHGIAVPLLADGIDVLHIYEDGAIKTANLKKAIDEETGQYDYYDLADVIADVAAKALPGART